LNADLISDAGTYRGIDFNYRSTRRALFVLNDQPSVSKWTAESIKRRRAGD